MVFGYRLVSISSRTARSTPHRKASRQVHVSQINRNFSVVANQNMDAFHNPSRSILVFLYLSLYKYIQGKPTRYYHARGMLVSVPRVSWRNTDLY